VAGGSYIDTSGHQHAFILNQVNGIWDSVPTDISFSNATTHLNSTIYSVSSSAPGYAVAVGVYFTTAGRRKTFAINQVNGTWDSVASDITFSNIINTISPPVIIQVSSSVPGYAVALGVYDSTDAKHIFFVNQVNGSWDSFVTDISFAYDANPSELWIYSSSVLGYAVAVGQYRHRLDYSVNYGPDSAISFVINQVNGTWDSFPTPIVFCNSPLHNQVSEITSVSYSAPGYAVAGGYYYDASSHMQAFVVNQVNGIWDSVATDISFANAASNPVAFINYNSVSSSAPGYAVAGGYYSDASNHQQAFVVNQVNGIWDSVATKIVLNNAYTNPFGNIVSVSSSAPGYAVAGGLYFDASNHPQAFVVNQVNGTWDSFATPIDFSNCSFDDQQFIIINIVSSSPGYAFAGGSYLDTNGNYQAFVINQVNGVWDSSATNITFPDTQILPNIASVSSVARYQSPNVKSASL